MLAPDARDLAVPAKPRLDPAALDSEHALNAHDDAVEAWGDGMARQIGRICRWFADNGVTGLDCPAPPPDG